MMSSSSSSNNEDSTSSSSDEDMLEDMDQDDLVIFQMMAMKGEGGGVGQSIDLTVGV